MSSLNSHRSSSPSPEELPCGPLSVTIGYEKVRLCTHLRAVPTTVSAAASQPACEHRMKKGALPSCPTAHGLQQGTYMLCRQKQGASSPNDKAHTFHHQRFIPWCSSPSWELSAARAPTVVPDPGPDICALVARCTRRAFPPRSWQPRHWMLWRSMLAQRMCCHR